MNLASNDTTAHAIEAYERGYVPVPVKPGTKRPFDPSWPSLRYGSADEVRALFDQEPSNLGIALGAPSGGLVDIDIDHAKGLTAARLFLGDTTPATGGRVSRPGSHYWYRVEDGLPEGTRKWSHPDRRTLVEMRSTGGQTVIAPSIHPDGERYVWGPEGPWGGEAGPALISGGELRSRVGCLALSTLLAIEWPTRGGRHDAYLALAGALLAEGYDNTRRVSPIWREFAPAVIAAIVEATHDEEGIQTRIEQSVESTLQKIARGKPTQGWPTLEQHLSTEVVERCKEFVFGIEDAEGHTRPSSIPEPDDLYGPYSDPGTLVSPVPPALPDRPLSGKEDSEDDAIEDHRAIAFERMVEHEVLRMEVREVAKERYSEVQAEKQLVANPDLMAQIRTSAEVLTDAPPEPARIDRLLPWNSSMLLVAQRKTGKTVWLCNLAHSLLTGEKFLNEFQVRALEPTQTVAILNFEVNGPMLADDLRRRGVPLDRLLQIDLRGRLNPFKHPSVRKQMAKQLRKLNVGVVMVDTFAQAFTGDSQNDTAEVGNWLRSLNEWVRSEVGANDLILTAHAGWDGDRARGSSALEDWADAIIHMKRADKDDMNSMRMMRANGREDVRLDWCNLPYDHESRTTWYEEIDADSKKAARADQALADMGQAEDAIRLALLQATEPLRSQELCDLAGGTEQGRTLSNRSLDQARQRLITLGEITTTRGASRGTPLLHLLNPDYVPDYAPDDEEGQPE